MKPLSANASQAYNLLLKKQYPPHIAAALVGNMMQESGWDINTGAVGDNGNSFGAVQWNGPRRRAYMDFAARRGVDPASLEAQIDYLDHELKTTEKGAFNKIMRAQTAEDAAVTASRAFWRPGDPREENRRQYAAAVAASGGGNDALIGGEGTDTSLGAKPDDPRVAALLEERDILLSVPEDQRNWTGVEERLTRIQEELATIASTPAPAPPPVPPDVAASEAALSAGAGILQTPDGPQPGEILPPGFTPQDQTPDGPQPDQVLPVMTDEQRAEFEAAMAEGRVGQGILGPEQLGTVSSHPRMLGPNGRRPSEGTLGRIDEWLSRPGMPGRPSNSELLLAIGSGLLSGNDWHSGLQGVAETTLNLGQAEEDRAIKAAYYGRASGGRSSRFIPRGNVRFKDGSYGAAIMDDSTGKYYAPDGTDISDQVALEPSKGDIPYADAPSEKMLAENFEKLGALDETMMFVDNFLGRFENFDEGVAALSTDVSSLIKTMLGSGLSSEEINQAVIKGTFPELAGRFRVGTVGGGAPSNYDIQNLLRSIGASDYSFMIKPEAVRDLLSQKLGRLEYEYDILDKQRKHWQTVYDHRHILPFEPRRKKPSAAPSTTTPALQESTVTPDEEEALKKKYNF